MDGARGWGASRCAIKLNCGFNLYSKSARRHLVAFFKPLSFRRPAINSNPIHFVCEKATPHHLRPSVADAFKRSGARGQGKRAPSCAPVPLHCSLLHACARRLFSQTRVAINPNLTYICSRRTTTWRTHSKNQPQKKQRDERKNAHHTPAT